MEYCHFYNDTLKYISIIYIIVFKYTRNVLRMLEYTPSKLNFIQIEGLSMEYWRGVMSIRSDVIDVLVIDYKLGKTARAGRKGFLFLFRYLAPKVKYTPSNLHHLCIGVIDRTTFLMTGFGLCHVLRCWCTNICTRNNHKCNRDSVSR